MNHGQCSTCTDRPSSNERRMPNNDEMPRYLSFYEKPSKHFAPPLPTPIKPYSEYLDAQVYYEETVASARICHVDVRKYFLIHAILVSLACTPLMYLTASLHGLILVPFSYALLLLTGAIWNNMFVLKTVAVITFVQLNFAVMFLFSLPIYIATFKPYSKSIPEATKWFICLFIIFLIIIVQTIFVMSTINIKEAEKLMLDAKKRTEQVV